MLGQFEFAGFPSARRGEVKIDVTFEIDTDGIVNVTAEDEETGQVASAEIRLASGLSEDEIQSLVAKQQDSDAAPADSALELDTAVVPLEPEPELETDELLPDDDPATPLAAGAADAAPPVAATPPPTQGGSEPVLSEADFPDVSGNETEEMQAAGVEPLGPDDDGVFDCLDEMDIVPPTADERSEAREFFDTSGGDLSPEDFDEKS